MTNTTRSFVLAALVALVASCSSPDPRCSLENCRIMEDSCHQQFRGEPDRSACYGAGAPPAGFDYLSYCPDACNAAESGGVAVECFASKQSQCEQGTAGRQTATEACTAKTKESKPARDPACYEECYSARDTCDKACPTTSFEACMDCSASCGLTEADCRRACPAI